jgi:hypothetical protein
MCCIVCAGCVAALSSSFTKYNTTTLLNCSLCFCLYSAFVSSSLLATFDRFVIVAVLVLLKCELDLIINTRTIERDRKTDSERLQKLLPIAQKVEAGTDGSRVLGLCMRVPQ